MTHNCTTLCIMLKKCGNLGKKCDHSSIKMVINISIKLDSVQDLIDLIDLILDNEKVHNIIQAIYIQDTFSFTYDVCEKVDVERDYSNSHHDVDNFKGKAKVAVEF